MYDYSTRKTSGLKNLEALLEEASKTDDWEVFAILPTTDPEDPDGPMMGQHFLVVARKPK